MTDTNPALLPVTQADRYRGWSIHPCEWQGWAATGPNYDASYEGPEDGWVDNGEKASAPTRETLLIEIDNWFEDHPEACVNRSTDLIKLLDDPRIAGAVNEKGGR